MSGVCFDAGGLIAIERGDRLARSIVARARATQTRITVPSTALAQVIRDPVRQSELSKLVRHRGTDVVPLDWDDATSVGRLLARTGTTDIVDAHVAIVATRISVAVLTSDADDLRVLAPNLELIEV